MSLNFEFFSPDDTNYYAIISRGGLIYSVADSVFVSESNISMAGAAILLSSGPLGRMYASIPAPALSDGIYVVRIYRGSYLTPSASDEIVAMERTAWSSALSSQVEPANADNVADIIAIDGLDARGYSIRLTGAFLGLSYSEVGLAEMFISRVMNICKISISIHQRAAGVKYASASIHTNDGIRTLLQGVSFADNGKDIYISFVPNLISMPYLMNGNFILAVGSSVNSLRIGGNPENKSVSSIPGVPNISFERTPPGAGISFRSV
jgi:hypothetical protein